MWMHRRFLLENRVLRQVTPVVSHGVAEPVLGKEESSEGGGENASEV